MSLSKEQEKWLEQNGSDEGNYANVPEELSTEEFWKAAVAKNAWALKYIPEAMKTEAVCLAAVQHNSFALKYVPNAVWAEAVCLAVVQQNGWLLEYVPEALKTEAVCLAAVQNGGSLAYVPEALKTEDLYIEVMKKSRCSYHYTQYSTARVYDGHPLQSVPKELQTEAVCLAAVLSDSDASRYTPAALWTEAFRAIVSSARSAISSGSGGGGYGIHLIKPKDLIVSVEAAYKSALTTEALCLAEVQKNGRALRYVPEEFKTEAVCLAAVKQAGHALAYVPEALKTEEIRIEATKHSAISSESGDLGGYGVGLISK
jgi:hypothetical protein